MKKKGFLILLGVLLLLNLQIVFAENIFATMFDTIRDFDLVWAYQTYPMVVESIVYLVIFISLGTHISNTIPRFKNKQGKILFVTVGIALAIMTMLGAREIGLTFASMAKYMILLVVFAFAYGIFYLVKLFGGEENKYGISGIAFFIAYFVANGISNNAFFNFFANNHLLALLRLIQIVAGLAIVLSIGSMWRAFRGQTVPPGEGESTIPGTIAKGAKSGWDWLKRTAKGKETPAETQAEYNQVSNALRGFVENAQAFASSPRNATPENLNTILNQAQATNEILRNFLNNPMHETLSRNDQTALRNLITRFATSYRRLWTVMQNG